MILLQRVRHCADDAEYEMLRQQWDIVNRRKQCFEDLNCVGRLGLGEAPEPSNVLGPRRGALPV